MNIVKAVARTALVAAVSFFVSNASAGTIAGDTIRIEVLFPNTSTSVEATDISVPNSQQFYFNTATATLTGNSILLNLDTPGCSGCSFADGVLFNGLRLTDLTNPSALHDWSVDFSLTTIGAFAEFISSDSIYIDLQSQPFSGQIAFQAGATVSVPGPVVGAGLPGLIMAFGGLLAWRRRKAIAA